MIRVKVLPAAGTVCAPEPPRPPEPQKTVLMPANVPVPEPKPLRRKPWRPGHVGQGGSRK